MGRRRENDGHARSRAVGPPADQSLASSTTGGGPVSAVPLVDLAPATEEIRAEVQRGFARVMDASCFIDGDEVRAFEEEFASFCERRFCVGVASGTDALELLLRAVGVGPGDEVVVPANSFNATAGAVVRLGARPVFADVEPDTLLLDVEQALPHIGSRTKALLPVHLYGQLAPMERLEELARARHIELVEDGAQAHGARRCGASMGTFGSGAALSFYPGKNLGAFGDGGAVVTDDPTLEERVRLLGHHGSARRYEHTHVGFNSRLDTLQAVVLRIKLARLEAWNEARRVAAARYDALLSELPEVRRPRVAGGNEHVWHLYVIRVRDRDRVLAALNDAGVGAGIHYPTPLHRQPAFVPFVPDGASLPVTEAAAAELLSLPLYPHITEEQQARVVSVLASALEGS
jgi:dTDP-4-amino-4,6-dideoxygalactose transaminase